MSSFQHPDEGLLLRYIDGELPGWKSRQVRRHLEACWQCRGSVEELQGTVAECVRYRKQMQAYIPAPPKPWPDLSREFARIDASFESEPFWKRCLSFPMLRQAAVWRRRSGAAVGGGLPVPEGARGRGFRAAEARGGRRNGSAHRPARHPHPYRKFRFYAYRGNPRGRPGAHARGRGEPVRRRLATMRKIP